MARKATASEAVEPEEEGGLRSQMWKHQLFVAWLKTEYGVNLEQETAANVIAWFAAKRNEFRKGEAYINAVNNATAEREEAKAARAAAPKAEKAAKATKATKAAKATKATKAAKATGPTKAARSRTRKAAAAATEDSPFA